MGIGGKTPAQAAKVDYPYKSWGDVVRSQSPKVELTKEDRTKYRVDRKMRAERRKRNPARARPKGRGRGDTQTTIGSMRG